MTIIGNNIRKRRIELSMTQEELAAKMGYKSKSTINKIELGINDIPQSKIVQFAEKLGTTPSDLMGWNEATEEDKKISDTKIGIADRIYNDNEFLSVVEMLDKLSPAQLKKAKGMLNLLFEESIDEVKK